MKRKKNSTEIFEQIGPQSSKQIPVNNKKKNFLRSFLLRESLDNKLFRSFQNYDHKDILHCPFPDDQTSILIIAGPPGCCKKTVVEILCKELDLKINKLEYSSQVSFWKRSNSNISFQSELDALESFLSSWSSIPTRRTMGIFANASQKNDIYLIPELPSINSQELRERMFDLFRYYTGYNACATANKNGQPLSQCINPFGRRRPLIIIHTIFESPSIYSSLAKSFPNDLIVGRFLKILEFNPITTSRIESILKEVYWSLNRQSMKSLSSKDFSTISENANGDLKQAIEQLSFNCINANRKRLKKEFDSPDISERDFNSSLEGSTEKKFKNRNRYSTSTDSTETKDNNLDIFHATAKILYGKRNSQGELEFKLNDLMRNVHSSEDTIINYVHHNIYSHFQNDALEDASKSLEYFAIADEFSARTSRDFGVQEDIFPVYSFQIASRGLLHFNKHHATNKYQHVKAPCTYIVKQNAEKSLKDGTRLFKDYTEEINTGLIDSTNLLEEVIPTRKILSKSKPMNSEQCHYIRKRDYKGFFNYQPEE